MHTSRLASIVLLLVTSAACTTSDELTDDTADEVEEADTDLIIAAGSVSGRLPFPQAWVSTSKKERAFTELGLFVVSEGVPIFTRKINVSCAGTGESRQCTSASQSGDFELTRNPTTGTRYIRFYEIDQFFQRIRLIDKYAYTTLDDPFSNDPAARFVHQPTDTAFKMFPVDSL
jgi:hypothetical protein